MHTELRPTSNYFVCPLQGLSPCYMHGDRDESQRNKLREQYSQRTVPTAVQFQNMTRPTCAGATPAHELNPRTSYTHSCALVFLFVFQAPL